MTNLDATDLKILAALQEDSSLTNRQLAAKVHLSPTPVFERVKKLKEEGYIKKYIAVLDVEKLNCSFMAICNIKMKQHSYENAQKIMKAVQEMDEIAECYNVTGDYDFQMKIYVSSMKEYQEFILRILGELDCIGGVNSCFVMGVVKDSNKIPVRMK
ncbi:MAG: Lrp/AsnC family transcriptional regulator [Bacteroidales bacterium]|nr:Lrp/AsnC family transcriptional regulator [Bacteroidales bacterium]